MKTLLRKIYGLMPFKGQIFKLFQPLKLPRTIYQHLHFKGWIKVKVDQSYFKIFHHGYQVENDLFWSGINGNWESQSLDLWIRLSKKSKTVLDIGANTGVYSLTTAAINNNAQIFAFEPGRRTALKLRQNVTANPFSIRVFETAISNKNGVASFYDTDEHNYTASLNSSHGKNTLQYEVKTQTLDSFIEENKIQVDLIKIDVERYEAEVMEGFQKYIRIQLPSILMEVLDEEVGVRVQQLIEGLPYLYFSLTESGGVRKVDTLTKSDDFNYLICREDVAKSISLI